MTTTLLKNTANSSQKSILKANKNRLVARWLVDENSKLHCQWEIENGDDSCRQINNEYIHYD